jgi:hypothetical protein
MSDLLDGIDTGDLLLRLPANVRASLETLERADIDWNAVGNLLAATPNAGIVFTGTGQWTSDLWQAVKWEFRCFLCTDSEPYADLRHQWPTLKATSSAHAVASLTACIGAKLGVAGGVLVPMLTWLIMVARRRGREQMGFGASAVPLASVPSQRALHA